MNFWYCNARLSLHIVDGQVEDSSKTWQNVAKLLDFYFFLHCKIFSFISSLNEFHLFLLYFYNTSVEKVAIFFAISICWFDRKKIPWHQLRLRSSAGFKSGKIHIYIFFFKLYVLVAQLLSMEFKKKWFLDVNDWFEAAVALSQIYLFYIRKTVFASFIIPKTSFGRVSIFCEWIMCTFSNFFFLLMYVCVHSIIHLHSIRIRIAGFSSITTTNWGGIFAMARKLHAKCFCCLGMFRAQEKRRMAMKL